MEVLRPAFPEAQMDHPLDTFGGIAILVANQQPLPVGMAAKHSVLGMQVQSSPHW
jgi:hypothetical protein